MNQNDKLDLILFNQNSIINHLELLLKNILDLKENQNKFEIKIKSLELKLNFDIENDIKNIKEDTIKMNHHINFVENGIQAVRSISPFKFLSFISPLKEIEDNNKEILERVLDKD